MFINSTLILQQFPSFPLIFFQIPPKLPIILPSVLHGISHCINLIPYINFLQNSHFPSKSPLPLKKSPTSPFPFFTSVFFLIPHSIQFPHHYKIYKIPPHLHNFPPTTFHNFPHSTTNFQSNFSIFFSCFSYFPTFSPLPLINFLYFPLFSPSLLLNW